MASSSSFDPLAAEPQPLKPSGGGKGLGGAQLLPEQVALVAPADEDAEGDIVDSQPDAYLDDSIVGHQQQLDDLRGELGGLLAQNPNLPFSEAPRVYCTIAQVLYPFNAGVNRTTQPAWVTAGQAVFEGDLVSSMCIANVMDAYLSLDDAIAIPRALNPQMNEYTYRHGRDVKSSWKVVPSFKNQ